jgi:threonine dehydrogenase-like Zn-dependent dehydrogenase
VLILGAGTVGLLWTAMFQHTPTARILQSEPIAFRRDKAQQIGADVVIDPHNTPIDQAVREHLPDGADYIIDATGNPAAIAQALPLLGRGGTLMVFGVCPPGHTLPVDPHEMFVKELTIIGSKMPPQALDRAARLIEAGRIPVDQIVTTHVGFDGLIPAVKGFESLRDQRVKTMLDPAR